MRELTYLGSALAWADGFRFAVIVPQRHCAVNMSRWFGLLLVALPVQHQCDALQIGASRPLLSAVTHRRHTALCMNEERKGVLGAWEDILDYLTNQGGYTGFTEGELKGENAQSRLNERDMTNFGAPKEGLDENVTNTFVIALIALGPVLLLVGVSIFGAPQIFTFAT